MTNLMIKERLQKLRTELARQSLDGWVLPQATPNLCASAPADLPPEERRLAYITGFTGSAGFAIILKDAAGFWTDSRYTLQAAAQVPSSLFTLRNITKEPYADWLKQHLKPGERLGYDPHLHTVEGRKRLQAAAERSGGVLVPIAENPVDKIWEGRTVIAPTKIFAHPLQWAGKPSLQKREEIAKTLRNEGQDAVVLTDPASLAWLLNIRGHDLETAPVALAFAILRADGVLTLFIDPQKLPTMPNDLGWGDGVSVAPPSAFAAALRALGQEKTKIRLDFREANAWIHDQLQEAGAQILTAEDPCLLPKAIKNEAESQGMREAHRRDGRALVRFLCWLDAQPIGSMTELSAADRLLAFRREEKDFAFPSFGTIAAAGPNGAIVHYRPTEETNRPITEGLFLLDSGGQYACGTTDVTRTLAIGNPAPEMKAHYTTVLRGHLALGHAVFAEGTSGAALDGIAREPLWQQGLHYDHGTGHGVGAFLFVHEGPQGIGSYAAGVPLRAGMVLSNEPGVYREGHYGIRIENLVRVTDTGRKTLDGTAQFAFETLTLAPYDRRLIDATMLDAREKKQINAYHAFVWQNLQESLSPAEKSWLQKAVAPLE